MAIKKTTSRGKSTPNKKTATKSKTKAKAPAKRTSAKSANAKQPKALQIPTIRRPDPNLPPSPELIDLLTTDILTMIEAIDNYTANLRALDRMRHNGVGLKRLGFIEAAYRISTNFPQYFPHWLNTAKFKADLDLFNSIRSLVSACRSLEEKAWNINIESADMIYTDALEYYSQVQDAANRRIDAAESLYTELHGFFRRGSMEGDLGKAAPTEKKTKRDINALMKGKKDGEVIIKNVKPKLTGGKHEVIDETFRDSASFKETDEGEFKE